MVTHRLQVGTRVGFGITFVGQLEAHQVIDITDTLLKLGRRELAQVSTQIWFQAIAIGGDIETTIEQVQQLQNDKPDWCMVITDAQHFAIG